MATIVQITIEDKGGRLDIQVGGGTKEPLTKCEAEFTTNLVLGIRKAILVMGGKNADTKADVAEILKSAVTKTH
ncbi:hypothetical protein ACFVQK_001292 [Salmonella enterica]